MIVEYESKNSAPTPENPKERVRNDKDQANILQLPTNGNGLFCFLRKVVILRDDPKIKPNELDEKLVNEWENIPEHDKAAYSRVADKRNSKIGQQQISPYNNGYP